MDNLPCMLSDSSGNMKVPFVDPIPRGRKRSRARGSTGDDQHHGQVVPIQKEEVPYNRKRSNVLASDDDLTNKKRRKTAWMPPPSPVEKQNIRCLKGLEMLRDECKDDQARMHIKSFELICFGDPLKDLGLYLKKEYCLGEDEEEEEEELLQSWECDLGEFKKETCDHDRKTNIARLEKKELTNKKGKTARVPSPSKKEKRNVGCLKG